VVTMLSSFSVHIRILVSSITNDVANVTRKQ
jgi:hypothetical protein